MSQPYYRFGQNQPKYAGLNRYQPPIKTASYRDGLRGLGDVTKPEDFFVPAADSPYFLDKNQSMAVPQFFIPKAERPYYLHRAEMGGIEDSLFSPAARTAAGAAMTYHGYKRTGSVGWALVWGILGSSVPIAAVPIALAQGFAKKKK